MFKKSITGAFLGKKTRDYGRRVQCILWLSFQFGPRLATINGVQELRRTAFWGGGGMLNVCFLFWLFCSSGHFWGHFLCFSVSKTKAKLFFWCAVNLMYCFFNKGGGPEQNLAIPESCSVCHTIWLSIYSRSVVHKLWVGRYLFGREIIMSNPGFTLNTAFPKHSRRKSFIFESATYVIPPLLHDIN